MAVLIIFLFFEVLKSVDYSGGLWWKPEQDPALLRTH